MPACNLSALVKTAASSCTYTPAGVLDRIYIFNVDDIAQESRTPANNGFYPYSIFTGIELFAIDIKSNSGKVTSSKSESDESRSLVATAVINYSFDKFMPIDTAMAFMNVGVIVPIDNKKAYVIMSPYRRTEYTCEFDSGDTYDSDHGFTITFTCSPVLYACPMVEIGTDKLSLSGASTEYDSTNYTAPSEGTDYGKVTLSGVTSNVVTVKVGGSATCTATTATAGGTVMYSTKDPSIATVSSVGIVSGIAAGETVLIATCGKYHDYAIVTVTAS